ncbi:ArnT family glycosyltransferase [cyanobacterium endosymbiont of Epithemia clementina EcSB]|uniref:ArnT family glycosyltransferase n=1 Tax=cyanobacterium endosymbiont of Epithemia clementina EcSB TaxID=3034674 RepID=UPI0024804931|nr:glycosyltransferase family 39 protein [cyanobacterium endosymbiont of Epithemia clementina EcSB]WGT67601.1 glycosyltransferase family 39 protein [cyanobacterium endosymbiont of Epithemia clementina EcSB]
MDKIDTHKQIINKFNLLKKSPKTLWIFSIIWLAIISWIAFLWDLGTIGLIDKTEPMFVEASRHMHMTGDWLTPYWNGETRFDKPPLTYWLISLSFKLFGVSEWAARFPSALFAIALVGLSFYSLHNFGFLSLKSFHSSTKKKVQSDPCKLWFSANLGAAIVAFNPFWIAWGRTAVSDMFLSSNIGLALLSFFIGYAHPEKDSTKRLGLSIKNWWYVGYWVFMALGVLAKGPVAIVLPGIIVIVFLLFVGRLVEVVKETPWLLGIMSFIAITIPWFVLITLKHGQEYINTFFGLHNIQRFTSVVSRHPGAWYYYFLVVLVGLVPWSIFLPLAIARLRFWKRKLWVSSHRSSHLGLFALVWFVVTFLFFSSSVTKLAGYILPLIPAAAIIVALFWNEQMATKGEKWSGLWTILFWLSGLANVGILSGLAVASFISPKLIDYDPMMPQFRELLQKSGVPLHSGIILSFSALGILILLFWKYHRRWIWAANLLGFIAFLNWVVLPIAPIVDSQRQLPLRELGTLIKQEQKPGEKLVFIGFMRPSITYYAQQTVDSITETDIYSGRAIEYFNEQVNHKNTSSTILIVAKPKYFEQLALKPFDYQVIGEGIVYQLIRIKTQTILDKNTLIKQSN